MNPSKSKSVQLLIFALLTLVFSSAGAAESCRLKSMSPCESHEALVTADLSNGLGNADYCVDTRSVWMVHTADFREYYFGNSGLATAAFYEKQTSECPAGGVCFDSPLETSAASALQIICGLSSL